MINLFIDTSRKNLSLALTSNEVLIDKVTVESHSKHSNYLMNALNNIFNNNSMSIYDVDNIVVTNGPGSFTGIRVGVTVAKTLSWSLSKKLFELSTLDALKIHVKDDVIISVFYDKKISSYVGIYTMNNNIKDYMNIDDERLNLNEKSITIVSYEKNDFVKDLYDKLSNSNNVKIKTIDDYDYVELINYAMKKEPINVHNSAPIYLKKIDAEKNN